MRACVTTLAAITLFGSPALAQTQGQTHASHGPAKPAGAAGKHDCEAMAKKMGLDRQHSHAEHKGTVAHSPMNMQHEHCKAKAKKSK